MFKIYSHKHYSKTYLKLGDFVCRNFQNDPHNRFKTKLICQNNGLDSILQYPKNKTIPERLIYEHKNKESLGWYTMFDKVEVIGWMRGKVEHINNSDYYPMKDYDTFFIHRLNADTYGMKVGSDFIKFAKQLSLKKGCEGRVCLVSANSKRPPHIFYRKMGFDCQDSEKMKILDNAITQFTPKTDSSSKVPAPHGSHHWVLKMFLQVNKQKP